jgi:hypothetical protein
MLTLTDGTIRQHESGARVSDRGKRANGCMALFLYLCYVFCQQDSRLRGSVCSKWTNASSIAAIKATPVISWFSRYSGNRTEQTTKSSILVPTVPSVLRPNKVSCVCQSTTRRITRLKPVNIRPTGWFKNRYLNPLTVKRTGSQNPFRCINWVTFQF